MSWREWQVTRQDLSLARVRPEKMPKVVQRLLKTEARWKKISKRGLAFFLLTRGLALFVWMCVCLLVFSYLGHTLTVLRQPIFFATALPEMLLLSLAAVGASWWVTKSQVEALSRWRAAGLVKI